MNKNLIYLSLILLLGILLRFFLIWDNPPNLNWDEAAFGYNAYSIGIDGRDEFGRLLPIDYLESYGDFKPPMYAYLDVVPVKLFGLNSFSVRFPSALIGSLAILATYFLIKEIFPKKENKEKLALLSALILAVSPWHIMLSRAAFEANVAMFFILLGTLFFLRFINGRKWEILLSSLFFSLSIYTFNTARVVAPLLVIALGIIFFKKIIAYKKQVALGIILGLVLVLPVVPFLLSPQASLRFKEVNIFTDPQVVGLSNRYTTIDDSLFSKVIHNRRVLYAQSYVKHYLDHFDPNFLFLKGDRNPRLASQDVGQMYLWDLPFILIGILILLRKKEGYYFVIPLAILISIIPAATARETPHALRIENAVPYFQILSAYGFLFVYDAIKKKRRKLIFLSISAILLFVNVLYFTHGLFVHYPREYSWEWQYGYKDSVKYAYENYTKYENINVTDKFGRPYIYYLLLNKYDPHKFRKNAKVERDAFGFVAIKSFDKFHFLPTAYKGVSKNALFIDVPSDVPRGAKIQKVFYHMNGDPTLVAYTI